MSLERLELREALHLDLADALAGQVHDRADLLERRAATVGDVERAGLGHLPDLEVGEIQLDRAGAGRHVEVEVVLAGDERARALALRAVLAHLRLLHVLDVRVEHATELELALRHALHADRACAHVALATRATLLTRHALLVGRCSRRCRARGPPRPLGMSALRPAATSRRSDPQRLNSSGPCFSPRRCERQLRLSTGRVEYTRPSWRLAAWDRRPTARHLYPRPDFAKRALTRLGTKPNDSRDAPCPRSEGARGHFHSE